MTKVNKTQIMSTCKTSTDFNLTYKAKFKFNTVEMKRGMLVIS